MQNKEVTFPQISANDPIAQVIQEAFGMALDVSGGWGYDREGAIAIGAHSTPLKQLQHTLASMRTHLEMSMTLPEAARYGGINLSELSRQTDPDTSHEAVSYRVTAMHESDYARFIKEYKEGHGTEGFDMEKHFQEREAATVKREIIVWFQIEAS